MKFKKINFLNLICIFVLALMMPTASAKRINYDFDITCECQKVKNNDLFFLNLNLTNNNTYYNNLQLRSFECKIKFDKSLFDFEKVIYPNKNIQAKDIRTEDTGDGLIINFKSNEMRCIPFYNHVAEILKLSFVCKSDLCCESYFETTVTDLETQNVLISQTTDINVQNECPQKDETSSKPHNTDKKLKKRTPYKTQNKTPGDCRLKSIVPNAGTLKPYFNPNIFKYKIEVPPETREIYFDVVPISENTNVSINKHRLSPPGTITYINITSKNQSQSLSYLIEVKRKILPSIFANKSHARTGANKIKNKEGKSILSKPKLGKFKLKMKSKCKLRKNRKSKKKHKNDIGDDEEETADEYCEDKEKSETPKHPNKTETKQLPSKNNKIYWIITFVILVSSVLIYLYFKKKSQLSSSDDKYGDDINNFFEK